MCKTCNSRTKNVTSITVNEQVWRDIVLLWNSSWKKGELVGSCSADYGAEGVVVSVT